MSITFPLFLAEGNDLNAFNSLDEFNIEIEPWLIERPDIHIFDTVGTQYKPILVGKTIDRKINLIQLANASDFDVWDCIATFLVSSNTLTVRKACSMTLQDLSNTALRVLKGFD